MQTIKASDIPDSKPKTVEDLENGFLVVRLDDEDLTDCVVFTSYEEALNSSKYYASDEYIRRVFIGEYKLTAEVVE